MQKPLTFLASLAFAATLALPVSAQETAVADPSVVVATVGDTEITVGHMIVAWASLPDQYKGLPDDVLFQGILDQLIQQTALQQKFTGELPKRVELQLENERRSLTAGEAINGIMEAPLDEAEVLAAYEADYGSADKVPEFNASHILVETEEEAIAVQKELAEGAEFEAVAREKSTGPSGPNGGQLGWFGKGAMVPEFEAAVIEMDVDAISDPVKTQFGWHVIKLNETRVQEAPPLEEVREEIELQIRQIRAQATIEEVTAIAKVDRSGAEGVNPSVLKQLEVLE
ncbi:peptidylprolyl isomerase [Sulfitobacter donghicola]|uniref:Parvulin-like PPIase n=1 Tax=Sulfitobacter donghicola DSW-25 = KCTC 12864 = JCM 14565 TaxID=1300350 RepID=A0A073ILS4_9RHOB|nr:peptidylprolyl isomerase [Sulfitobacter donghicola]KEJ90694.1 peptidyl-prolyl cis-trans isomerase [Sulfitobacter donghicola DSW-25 = KCTC 12864 = JCM 14565]KIN67947.1 Ppic-type ppiase domain protein [Sulfitobacter donghicola DSW-25 = KCTC 12864 = JCM 14565]